MLRQKAKMSSFRGGVCREQMQVEQCALHPSSCFSFRWRVDWRTEESVTALRSCSLVLIIVRPSICHVIDMPPRVMKSPGMPLAPPAREGLSLLGWHCSLFTPGQTWFDRREALVIDDSTTYLQPQQSGPALPLSKCLCVGVHVYVCATVWMWQWIENSYATVRKDI